MEMMEKLRLLELIGVRNPERALSFQFDLQLFAAEDEGRTEDPTEYKKRKAREEGNIPKSQELTAIIVLLMGFWTVSLIGTHRDSGLSLSRAASPPSAETCSERSSFTGHP